MFGNAFQFFTTLVVLAALAVMVDARAAEWAGARFAAWFAAPEIAYSAAPLSVATPAPRPEPAAFGASAGPLTAAEACVAVWAAVDGVGAVTPHGGRPIGGGVRAAGTAPAEKDLYGCVGVSDAAGPVFVVAKATNRDVWAASSWRVDALCDKQGALIGGRADSLCAWSPL